ncbi:MAG TPA: LysM peptidoglycan-binding domain-containing protein [Herpetosiphonaceae bacterium]|nr:LysM peptidoglycan-binding domain-containing protein [Herpetosiphonaceae bacterium]
MALEKAVITNTVTGDRIPVMFNPEEYTVSKDNNFAQIAVPGLRAPLLQFVNGNMQTLEMELFVDTYEVHRDGSRLLNQAGEDVRNLTRKITSMLDIDPTTHAPPVLQFVWGPSSVDISRSGTPAVFTCVLARASQRFIMFLPDGTPVRARLQVTFNEFTNAELEAKEIKRETSDFTKVYEVKQGETLSAIAWRTYGNPRLWQPIALRNAIDNPRAVPAGMRLIVPQLPFRDPHTGEIYQ